MDLMRRLPWRVYHDQEHVADLQRAWGKELDVLIACRDDYYQQMRPGTATWGLALFEREYAIMPDPTKALDRRLAIWRAKRRGQGTTTTPVLRQTAEMVTGLPATITEFPELDYFQIMIHSQGQPMDILDLIKVIEEIKPAHLGMVFGWRVTSEQTLHLSTLGGIYANRRHPVSPPGKTETTDRVKVIPQAYTLHSGCAAISPPPAQIVRQQVRPVALSYTYTRHFAKGAMNYG